MTELCSLFSGSSGNCIYVGNDDTAVLIDAGVSGSRVISALIESGKDPSRVRAIFVSHEHGDHIRGVGIVSRKLGVPVYANSLTWDAIGNQLGKLSSDMCLRAEHDGSTVHIGSLEVEAFATPHDAADPQFYSVYDGGTKVTVCTDVGHIDENLYGRLRGSEAVLLESNHDIGMLQCGPYPFYLKQRILSGVGHLSNDDAAATALRLVCDGTRHIILGHLSRENNYPQIAGMTTRQALTAGGVDPDRDISLQVASHDCPGRTERI